MAGLVNPRGQHAASQVPKYHPRTFLRLIKTKNYSLQHLKIDYLADSHTQPQDNSMFYMAKNLEHQIFLQHPGWGRHTVTCAYY